MVETFTTDFVSIEDGDVTPYTPQELVQQNALIDVVSAEVQWRGVSETEFTTERGSSEDSDSASAFIREIDKRNSNSSTETTAGTVETDSETKTDTRSTTGGRLEDISIGKPPDPRSKYPNATVEPIRIEANYYVVERGGGLDRDVGVEFDDDPYNAANYDSSARVDVQGEKKRVGGFSDAISSWDVYDSFDGAQIRYTDFGRGFQTNRLAIDITLTYRITTREQEITQKRVSVTYPSIPSGASFDYHRIRTYIDGEYRGTEYVYSNKVGEVYSERTPPEANSRKQIIITTEATSRQTVSQTASVTYPQVADTFSFDRHEIEITENGETVRSDVFYENDVGETVSRTSNKPTDTVTITAKTFYSKVVSTTFKTTNPSVEGDFLPERVNTDSIAFLFDTSTSVNQTKQEEIGRRVLSQLGESTTVSVTEFDYTANVLVEGDKLSNNRTAVTDAINSLDKSGGTDMSVGLTEAFDSLDGEDGTIIVISDGVVGDDPLPTAETIGNKGAQVVTIQVGQGETNVLERIANVTNGVFFDGTVDTDLFGLVLDDNQLSDFTSITGVTRDTQEFVHSIDGSGKAEFRLRFSWDYLTPEPTVGTTGFYDESADVWREVAVADTEDSALQYTHVQVYNNSSDEWGALDVVDLSNENALEAFQFYDEDVGWVAPRQFNTV